MKWSVQCSKGIGIIEIALMAFRCKQSALVLWQTGRAAVIFVCAAWKIDGHVPLEMNAKGSHSSGPLFVFAIKSVVCIGRASKLIVPAAVQIYVLRQIQITKNREFGERVGCICFSFRYGFDYLLGLSVVSTQQGWGGSFARHPNIFRHLLITGYSHSLIFEEISKIFCEVPGTANW